MMPGYQFSRPPQTDTSSSRGSPFAALLGATLSGFGQGMMDPKFASRYNAAQQGTQDISRALSLGERMQEPALQREKLDFLKRTMRLQEQRLLRQRRQGMLGGMDEGGV